MTETPLDRLTARETEAIRAHFKHGHRGLAAAALNISENTLKTHLSSARRKLAMPDHQIAGLLFPDRVDPHPKRVSPQRVIDQVEPPIAMTTLDGAEPPMVGELRDGGWTTPRFDRSYDRRHWWERRNDLTILQRLTLIALMMIAVVACYVLSFAMADGVQRIADQVNPISKP